MHATRHVAATIPPNLRCRPRLISHALHRPLGEARPLLMACSPNPIPAQPSLVSWSPPFLAPAAPTPRLKQTPVEADRIASFLPQKTIHSRHWQPLSVC